MSAAFSRRSKPAPVSAAVLNYLRTAAWRDVGPVPTEWLIRYIYGQDTKAARFALQRRVEWLRRQGFPIKTVREFGYEFRPVAGQPKWPRKTRVTMRPAMPQISPPAQTRTSHHSDRTEAEVRS